MLLMGLDIQSPQTGALSFKKPYRTTADATNASSKTLIVLFFLFHLGSFCGPLEVTYQCFVCKPYVLRLVLLIAYPGAPLDLSVSRVSDSHLLVRWKPPADDGGDHIRSYVLMLRNSRLIWRQTLPGSNLIAVVTVSNLSHDSNYLVSVLAQNTFGQSVTVDTLYRYSEPAPRPSNSSRANTPPSVGMTMSPVVPSMTSPAVTRQGDGDDLIQIVHVALSAGAFCLVCIISVYAILHYRKNRRHNTVGRRNRNSREW